MAKKKGKSKEPKTEPTNDDGERKKSEKEIQLQAQLDNLSSDSSNLRVDAMKNWDRQKKVAIKDILEEQKWDRSVQRKFALINDFLKGGHSKRSIF